MLVHYLTRLFSLEDAWIEGISFDLAWLRARLQA
jgi:hypothetical protein